MIRAARVCALLLLALALPARADQAIIDFCVGPDAVTSDLELLTSQLQANAEPGGACLRSCSSGATLCNKLAKLRFKCLSRFSKGKARNLKLLCLANGSPRQQCSQDAAAWQEADAEPYTTQLYVDRGACGAALLTCQAVCTP